MEVSPDYYKIKAEELDGVNGGKAPYFFRYTVKEGDTLQKIGRKCHVNWRTFYSMNRDIIGSDPNNLKPGIEINIFRA